ncbi:DUF3298 and DUF4163 domain-containing protein [Winogradskyella sp.]|uniref:DUF3298 and DUF4163 domain-containing protein n=1 Tax=Winogradskyella sp. TaxID=1883156 RepID=UPI00261C43B2|nr:DUF3298 and DUF4163 domain-containing protein [Winogradskyella sp.]
MKRITFILVLFCFLNSCKSEYEAIAFATVAIENTYEAQISANLDRATGNDELSKKINTHIDETIVASLSDTINKSNLETILKDFNQEYLDFKNDFPEASEAIWELHIETEKTYQTETIISIAISTYEFQGGAHGNDRISFLNLNAETGDILSRDQMINNLEDFKTLAKIHFEKSLKNREESARMEDFFFGKPFQLPENIGYSDDGLVLLYNVYEIASYDQGYTEFVIPFEEVEPYLKLN